METTIIAVPSTQADGIESPVDEHFGHCAAYTIVELRGDSVAEVRTMANNGHEHGDCTAPVKLLAESGVKVLIAGGMGMRPLMAFDRAGITVFHNAGSASVRDAVDAWRKGKLIRFSTDLTCQGGCGNHGHAL